MKVKIYMDVNKLELEFEGKVGDYQKIMGDIHFKVSKDGVEKSV